MVSEGVILGLLTLASGALGAGLAVYALYWTVDTVPSEFASYAPQLVTLVVLAVASQRLRPPAALDDLARSMGARPLRRLTLIQLPAALPALGSGLRLAAVQAPLAVIVGEWVGSSRGLGHVMLMANGRGQTDLMFAALAVLTAMGLALFAAAGAVQRLTEKGRPEGRPLNDGGR